jgi:hypothetical protein
MRLTSVNSFIGCDGKSSGPRQGPWESFIIDRQVLSQFPPLIRVLVLVRHYPGDMRSDVSGNSPTYHPSYEFPGSDEISSRPGTHTHTELTPTPSNDFPICRLVIQEGRFIAKKCRLAVIDGYSEVQIGRDASPPGASTPRIRLKDMEVSKLHATLFWDAARTEWAVVDMGSKHGTFVGSGEDTNRVRLSASRVASMPKRLKHLDRLSLGGTTFVVHVHENRLPCSDCSASGQGSDDLIPLFSHQRDGGTGAEAEESRKRCADSSDDVPRNAKKALASLKHRLLRRPGGDLPAASPHERRSN